MGPLDGRLRRPSFASRSRETALGDVLGWQSGQMRLAVDEVPLRLRGFESLPQHHCADIAQLAERILGKNEVPGSTPGVGSTESNSVSRVSEVARSDLANL